jgi:hypothetical protein
MIDNMRSHCRLKRSNWGYRPRSAFLEGRPRWRGASEATGFY